MFVAAWVICLSSKKKKIFLGAWNRPGAIAPLIALLIHIKMYFCNLTGPHEIPRQ